jgi:hypothetical protein
LVAWLIAITVAPGTAAPVESLMRPVNEAAPVWAKAVPDSITIVKRHIPADWSSRGVFMAPPFGVTRTPLRWAQPGGLVKDQDDADQAAEQHS